VMNIEKKYAYVIIALLVLVTGVLIVKAGIPATPNPGHDVYSVAGAARTAEAQGYTCNVTGSIPTNWSASDFICGSAYSQNSDYATTAGKVPFTIAPFPPNETLYTQKAFYSNATWTADNQDFCSLANVAFEDQESGWASCVILYSPLNAQGKRKFTLMAPVSDGWVKCQMICLKFG